MIERRGQAGFCIASWEAKARRASGSGGLSVGHVARDKLDTGRGPIPHEKIDAKFN